MEEEFVCLPAPTGKKRIPVKCDGEKPCSRCHKMKKHCVFFVIPKDPAIERLENVESEVHRLREQVDEISSLLRQSVSTSQVLQELSQSSHGRPESQQVLDSMAITGCEAAKASPVHSHTHSHLTGEIPVASLLQSPSGKKRKRSGFEVQNEPVADFISKGLITIENARSFFKTFFEGCDRSIPIFDPVYDTFESVRARSSILLNAICTIGCRVEAILGTSSMSDLLHAELKKWINVIIQNERLSCLESVQALLVVACYSAERSLILSFATRMALDLRLEEAYEELTQRLALREEGGFFDVEQLLMRKSRTWFGLVVLEHILRVDGGKPPGIRLLGHARRCRLLLGHPSSTVLDLRLLSQVELNVLRATINDTLATPTDLDKEDIVEFVHGTKADLDVWFDDWLRIIANSSIDEQPYLDVAVRVQKCWAEMMMYCKALRAMGVENVATMSAIERNILFLAKVSARNHLRLITETPHLYLAQLKYAMDFVWAKCAFCFLLLLKLSRLLPEGEDENDQLLAEGNRLVDELTRVGNTPSTSTSNGTTSAGGENMYLQILRVSIEKYGRALRDAPPDPTGPTTAPFWDLFDAQADLQSFVPEQFVSEWDFPGLNLFYFPTGWQDFFGEFSLRFD
ncbi:hypothetical protein ASPZODRAFT_63086 [Penicilliopsis zonata CBS 506.65]|uniref:Uncharacterized protein n=1 Tax=Penicilliopsis zonata CBS 506.65 TaxID=1073090 RepID=A0A1L9SJX1_9EURO|nr:hypothetical protein ASPZODRAFT_63086 [Penicilliopsis zonata CBS 506.65]OJJ47532.1 hypothetical protein ASPZODRAFT_63086 [Penicilliopsis zonata CBS 506.65]